MNRNQTKINELFKALNPIDVGRIAGSGNKAVYMLDQQADYYINLVSGIKYWDMCASEALIEAKMGICTDARGKALIYDHNLTDYTIKEGIIIAKNMKVYNLARQRCMENLGITIEEFFEEVKIDTFNRREKRRLASL